ncbi:MAG TPA: hypothetical protein VGS10_10490 [Terracidiphilus sp.]|nr:hypothetical protein [Terracidiphilus sp.]
MASAFPTRQKFVHRSNRNGTTDSVCRDCFATVATAIWEAELERKESAHLCDPWTVERFKKIAREEVRPVVLSWHATA